jgi:hypothetical protein
MRDAIELAREAEFSVGDKFATGSLDDLKHLVALARADERMSFYGQDKPAECAEGCPPNQICDYCQVVAPVKAMIFAEREAMCDIVDYELDSNGHAEAIKIAIRARGNT